MAESISDAGSHESSFEMVVDELLLDRRWNPEPMRAKYRFD
jgi:hypothetical protein